MEIHVKHILRLIKRDADEEGWAKVGEKLYKFLSEGMPSELTIFEKLEDGGRARLTEEGESVVNAMRWLDT